MSDNKKKPKKKEDNLERPKVWVVGGGFEYIRLFWNLGADGATGLDDADVVVFTGGEDVYPGLYGEVSMAKTNFNRIRDDKEKAIFDAAVERGLPMVGVCRGGQFLNVMNGGKLWQHVTNHAGNHHLARIELPPFNNNGKRRTIQVTSTHHQMMIPTDDAIVLLTACEAQEKHSPAYAKMGKSEEDPDTEAVWYADTNCLCFQPHPEFASCPAECVDFFEELWTDWVIPMIPSRQEKAIRDQSLTARL